MVKVTGHIHVGHVKVWLISVGYLCIRNGAVYLTIINFPRRSVSVVSGKLCKTTNKNALFLSINYFIIHDPLRQRYNNAVIVFNNQHSRLICLHP